VRSSKKSARCEPTIPVMPVISARGLAIGSASLFPAEDSSWEAGR
jgi:hypothetical protein